MRSFRTLLTVRRLAAFLVLIAGAGSAAASSVLPSPGAFPLPVERVPDVARIIRLDDQALFVLEPGFLRQITQLTDADLEARPAPELLAVIEAMRPGDYLLIPQQKTREILSVEIAPSSVYLETLVLERHPRGSEDKGQYVGEESWPYDIPILDLNDQTLFNGEINDVPVTIVANHLFIEMSGNIIFGYNVDIIPPDIYYLLWEFDSDLAVTIDYTTMVGGALDHDFDLLSFHIPVYTVGWATITVDVALPTELTTDGPVCLGGGLSFDFGYSVGFEVLGDEIEPIWTTAPENFTDLDPAYGAEANASFKTTVSLGVSATIGIPELLDLVDASFDLGVYSHTVGVKSPCTWSLDAGVDSHFAITEITGWLCGPGECDWELFDASIYSDYRTCDQLTDNCACNAMVCPTGCCAGNSCEPGTADEACGMVGDACVTCDSDQHCIDGECVAACDAQLCPNGCCDGVICKPGDADGECGTGGAACVACDEHQDCHNQQCRQRCDSDLCPMGCCSGRQCQPGDTNEFCGTSGADCQTCEVGTHCEDGECAPGVDDDDDNDDSSPDDDDDDDDDDNNDDSSPADDDASPPAEGDNDNDDSGGCGC
jgi:hypothetical protein